MFNFTHTCVRYFCKHTKKLRLSIFYCAFIKLKHKKNVLSNLESIRARFNFYIFSRWTSLTQQTRLAARRQQKFQFSDFCFCSSRIERIQINSKFIIFFSTETISLTRTTFRFLLTFSVRDIFCELFFPCTQTRLGVEKKMENSWKIEVKLLRWSCAKKLKRKR